MPANLHQTRAFEDVMQLLAYGVNGCQGDIRDPDL